MNPLEGDQFVATNYLARTGTNTALFINQDNGNPNPNRRYNYQSYDGNTFWHWFYRIDDGEEFTVCLEESQDYDDNQYDLLDSPQNLVGTFGIYSWANTIGEGINLQGRQWNEVEIFSRIRDFILKRVPLRYYPHMFDIEWTHPLQYTPAPRPPPVALLQVFVQFQYYPAGRPTLVHVRRNRIPQGAIAGGRGTYLTLGESAQFLMIFPNNPEIQSIDLYPFMRQATPNGKRVTSTVRRFLTDRLNLCRSISLNDVTQWVHTVVAEYFQSN